MTWIQRNWKWVTAVCVLGVAGAVFGFIMLIMGLLKSSGAYELAMEHIRNDPRAVAALGEPIRDGFMPTGSIHTSGPSGEAELNFRLHGPDDSGHAYVYAERRARQWELKALQLVLDSDGGQLDLLEDHHPANP